LALSQILLRRVEKGQLPICAHLRI